MNRVLHSISSYFTRENIAYNMFISRGTRFGEGRGSKEMTVRVVIWPRKSQFGKLKPGNISFLTVGGFHFTTERFIGTITKS